MCNKSSSAIGHVRTGCLHRSDLRYFFSLQIGRDGGICGQDIADKAILDRTVEQVSENGYAIAINDAGSYLLFSTLTLLARWRLWGRLAFGHLQDKDRDSW